MSEFLCIAYHHSILHSFILLQYTPIRPTVDIEIADLAAASVPTGKKSFRTSPEFSVYLTTLLSTQDY